MRALLLSAYSAASHRRWVRGLTSTLDDVDWTVLELPPRHFRWRKRGNPLWWAVRERDVLEQDWDVVLATSMVDLSTLLGLAPTLSRAHVVVYFHENQLAYPTRDGKLDIQLGITDLYAALAADRVLFNSEYNRTSMLEGVAEMLEMLPDYAPHDAIDLVAERSTVIPVGLEDEWYADPTPDDDGPMTLVWNHRWEYDKAPARFFDALRLLRDDGVDFRVHVVGQQFRDAPAAFAEARRDLDDQIVTFGFVEDVEQYRAILRESDVVVSTALHEFQGLAVLEAVASGCVAAVPDRLAYREFHPPAFRFPSHPDDPAREARALAAHLADLSVERPSVRATTEELRWINLTRAYRSALSG